ncbi:uroporphyrinogen-III synthase [Rhodopila sp.]|uniref:uroporphyrinogen-III synthase n=1 Tax=Rhodopila sp. TaxID=2480087 RepID=UPI003D0AA2F0
MKRVLITRPEPGATQTAARLTAIGFLPVIAPVLTINSRQIHAPDHLAATLLTSRNAVAACPPSLHGSPVFAVGAATATLASNAGFRHVFSADGDAEVLGGLVADTLSPEQGSLFLPTGQGQGIDFAASLRQRGFHVVRRVAYQVAAVPVLPAAAAFSLRQGELAAALFFSSATSRHFARLLQAAELAEAVRGIEAVSISERAAMPLRVLRWRRVRVAEKPNQDAMLVLLND